LDREGRCGVPGEHSPCIEGRTAPVEAQGKERRAGWGQAVYQQFKLTVLSSLPGVARAASCRSASAVAGRQHSGCSTRLSARCFQENYCSLDLLLSWSFYS